MLKTKTIKTQLKNSNKIVKKSAFISSFNPLMIKTSNKKINFLKSIIDKELNKNKIDWNMILQIEKTIKNLKLEIQTIPFIQINNNKQLKSLKGVY